MTTGLGRSIGRAGPPVPVPNTNRPGSCPHGAPNNETPRPPMDGIEAFCLFNGVELRLRHTNTLPTTTGPDLPLPVAKERQAVGSGAGGSHRRPGGQSGDA